LQKARKRGDLRATVEGLGHEEGKKDAGNHRVAGLALEIAKTLAEREAKKKRHTGAPLGKGRDNWAGIAGVVPVNGRGLEHLGQEKIEVFSVSCREGTPWVERPHFYRLTLKTFPVIRKKKKSVTGNERGENLARS